MTSGDRDRAVRVVSTLVGTVVRVPVAVGEPVAAGQAVCLVESMKMEHALEAPVDAVVRAVRCAPGATVAPGDLLVELEPAASPPAAPGPTPAATGADPLDELAARRRGVSDEGRPEAVARRRRLGKRTARENVAAVLDPGTFEEYGSFALAAQRARRSPEDLLASTPADGLVMGLGRVGEDRFGARAASVAVLAYDYTVLAGTQGAVNHQKKDRLFDVVRRLRLPLVCFTEGGGGRPGDTDTTAVTGLDVMAFALFAELSGLVPLVRVASGRCFAGNAALLGCCDVVIATADATIGMGGPAMIEGGGLGTVAAEAVGPLDAQVANGVVDIPVADEAEAAAVARRYLSYFQGPVADAGAADQAGLRTALPVDRRRAYDVRPVVDGLFDRGSVLELRAGFAPAVVTALARLAGRPVGVVANNPAHLSGAIDADGADKAARFLQLCDAFDLPLVFLCDTPGFLVGPDSERAGAVRHMSRLFLAGASLTVPFVTVVLRRAYGLGAQAMAGGSFRRPLATVAWSTGELGGMGLEGAVRLGFRRELEAETDPEARAALFESMVARAYERGRALHVASVFEIDEVIDPADTRRRLVRLFDAAPAPPRREGKKRPFVDAW